MKTLLINPPQIFPKELLYVPLGLAYLASMLKTHGYEVKVKDMTLHSWDDVRAEIKKEDPDIVGIGCLTLWRNQTIKTARIAKEYNPNIKVVIGGPHATFYPEHMFKMAPVDVVVIGEGEMTIVELVEAFNKGKKLSEIKGIAFLQNGKIIRTETRPLIKSIDEIPFPSYDDFNLRKYNGLNFPKKLCHLTRTAMITSRGCPFACHFCSTSRYWGRFWRARSPKNVVDEIEWLYNEYDVRLIHFFDDIFTLNRDRVIEICKEILRRELDVLWQAETRVDCVDREMLIWMRKAGCREINYGIESGSAKILRNIDKRITPEQIRKALRMTHEADIRTIGYLIVGNPGEDKDTINETIKLMKEFKPFRPPLDWDHPGLYVAWSALLSIFPNTPIYELSKLKGIIDDDYWLTDKPTPYYTGEHTLKELVSLKIRLDYNTRSKVAFAKSFFGFYIKYLGLVFNVYKSSRKPKNVILNMKLNGKPC
jgi:radical SAM superfamily enzyme YgiQ (UPF0313 family)